MSFFSVLYIWSPYSIEMNWQHINNNVYYEKGQERSIRMTHRKKAITRKPRKWKKKTRDWELLLHLSLWKTLRVTWKLLLAWNLHITTSVLIITFCKGCTTLLKKQFLFSSEFRQRVYLITASNGAIPHLQHKMCNKRLVSNGNVNSSLPQTTQIWWFKVVVL